MRIAVFGAGGVGGYFGGRLAEAGEDVTFIARGSHLAAIREHGLRVRSVAGDFTVADARATDDPAKAGPVDAVIVAVKAWQVPEAAERMRPLIGPDTVVVPLENGVEAADRVAEILGRKHAAGGLCRIIAFIEEPGVVRHAGADPYVAFGELDNRPSDRLDRLLDAFSRARGVAAERPDDIQAAVWKKFLLIASWSGVGAATRAPIGVIREMPETRRMLTDAMAETARVARARRIDLPAEAIDQAMAFVDGLAPGGTASMQRDIAEGRPSELEQQNGAVVRLGREAGVETPVHACMYHSLLPLERRARGEIRFD